MRRFNSRFPGYVTSNHLILGIICLLLLLPLTARTQDYRLSASYSWQKVGLSYTSNSLFGGDVTATRKGVVQVELEKYLLYRFYVAGQADYLLHNQQGYLFGGPIDFRQANLGGVIGLQWPKWGVFAGAKAGRIWNLQFRGVNTAGERITINPVTSVDAWTTSFTGGIKYYLVSFLRLQLQVDMLNNLPDVAIPTAANGISGASEVRQAQMNPFSVRFGVSLSIPWNTRKYNRGSGGGGGSLPELRSVKSVQFDSPMPRNAIVTSPFGPRWRGIHEGIDIDAERGDPIKSAADGIVIKAGKGTGYGKMVKIDHGGGYVTVYAHLSKIKVKLGEKVKRGDVIGKAGNTGTSSGPHLHFEIQENGTPIDPQTIIRF